VVPDLGAAGVVLRPPVDGSLEVDGTPLAELRCQSGQRLGFAGVEIKDASGRRLRLGTTLDGTGAVAYFPPGSLVGENLPACASVDIRPGVGVLNGIRNLDGVATLSCVTSRHRITGSLSLESCH